MMWWTAPIAGIAMCQIAAAVAARLEDRLWLRTTVRATSLVRPLPPPKPTFPVAIQPDSTHATCLLGLFTARAPLTRQFLRLSNLRRCHALGDRVPILYGPVMVLAGRETGCSQVEPHEGLHIVLWET